MKRNYNNSIIYVIESKDLYYIGSTTQTIEQRLQSLRYYNFYSYREHESLKRLLCSDDMKINILEHYNCNDKDELQKRLRYWRSIYNIEYLNNRIKTRRHKYVRSYKKNVQPIVIETDITINWDR